MLSEDKVGFKMRGMPCKLSVNVFVFLGEVQMTHTRNVTDQEIKDKTKQYWIIRFYRSDFLSKYESFALYGLVHLFNDISTPFGLFNAKTWFICKGYSLIWFPCLIAFQPSYFI